MIFVALVVSVVLRKFTLLLLELERKELITNHTFYLLILFKFAFMHHFLLFGFLNKFWEV